MLEKLGNWVFNNTAKALGIGLVLYLSFWGIVLYVIMQHVTLGVH